MPSLVSHPLNSLADSSRWFLSRISREHFANALDNDMLTDPLPTWPWKSTYIGQLNTDGPCYIFTLAKYSNGNPPPSKWLVDFWLYHCISPISYILMCSACGIMTPSNGDIFHVTGLCAGNSPVNSPHKDHCRGALIFSFICVWINGWVNNRKASDWDDIAHIMTSV